MSDEGSITIEASDPIRVCHRGSFAFVYGCIDSGSVRAAARHLIDVLNQSEDPAIVIVDVEAAQVRLIPLAWFQINPRTPVQKG